MSEQEKNALKFIKSLKRRKSVTELDVYSKNDDPFWFYYFNIIGYFKNKYFHVAIRSCSYEIKRVEIVNTTDCKEEIEKILTKYKLL
jgi:hypothetical protein